MSTDHSYETTAHYYDGAYATVTSLGADVAFYRALAVAGGGPAHTTGSGLNFLINRLMIRRLA